MAFSPGGWWISSQRRGLIIVLAVLLLILGIRLILNPATISDQDSSPSPSSDQLADRIDPNFAQPAELAAIPNLGEKRAQAIVDYRNRYTKEHPGLLAFTQVRDLEKVSGIGMAMVEKMKPYLIFPSQNSTQP